jgi:hypothetical protein
MVAPASQPACVAVSSTDVYWTDYTGTVYRVSKSGGTPNVTELFDAGVGASFPIRCAIDSSFLYLTDYFAGVYRVPLSGGDPVLMVSPTTTKGALQRPIALDSQNVYFGMAAAIASAPKTAIDASTGIAIVPNLLSPGGLSFDPATSAVYWSDYGADQASSGMLGKVGEDGGVTVLSSGLPRPIALTVTGNDVFWLSHSAFDSRDAHVPNTGALWRQPK